MIPRQITIHPALNGYVVTVGCQNLVFEKTETLLSELKDYLADPGKVEQYYRDTALHKDKLAEACPAPDTGLGAIGLRAPQPVAQEQSSSQTRREPR